MATSDLSRPEWFLIIAVITHTTLDFQKIYPKARDVVSQAELIKDDITGYNRIIADLNNELQMIPERCPSEMSVMCDIIANNRLHAENCTYLVRKYYNLFIKHFHLDDTVDNV